MKFTHLQSVTLTFLAVLSNITYAAQCQAPNGKFYPYDSPQCDPKVTKCSSNIDHLIRQKTIDSDWMQELQRLCRGAKIDQNGKITVLDGEKFHTFNLGIQNASFTPSQMTYPKEIIGRCKNSSKKLDCQYNETQIYCSSLSTAMEKSTCFKQMQRYFESKVTENEKEIERAKREAHLRIQKIRQDAGGGS